jgi:Ca2+/H+ antiporter
VWITSILSKTGKWRPELLKEISIFTVLDLTIIFLAFFIINMVATQGKSTYFSGVLLVTAYIVYLLVNFYE